MNTKFFIIGLFVLVSVTSCKKENDSSGSIPKFGGITITRSADSAPSIEDPTDWRIDDEFTAIEQSLFDTLKFESPWILKSNIGDDLIAEVSPRFYPNPVSEAGYFRLDAIDILNVVIVDQSFNKKIKYRGEYSMVRFDFSSFSRGLYRMYYVLQDSSYRIVGVGHGDIEVGDNNESENQVL